MEFNIWKKSEGTPKPLKKIEIVNLKLGKYNDTMRIKISFKSEKRSTRYGGQFFYFVGFDGANEIQITCFTNEAKKFFDLIEFDHIYDMTNFEVQLESKEYPSELGTEFKIKANSETDLKEIEDDTFPNIVFKFTPLDEIDNLEINTNCDVLAVICKDWGTENIPSGKIKRDFSCTDKTKNVVVLSFWGSTAESINLPANATSTVFLRNAKVSQYQGKKYFNCFSNTLVWWNPKISEATELKDWFEVEIKEIKN